MRLTILVLISALLSMGLSVQGWSMADEDLNQDILEMKKQLLAMETRNGRSLDVYELRFQPQTLKHITIVDRLGEGHVFYYLPYRLRNPGSEGNAKIEEEYPRYNEILKNIADEFEDITVDGGKLSVDTDTENDAAAVVLKRKELEASERTVRLSIMAHDENGSDY